MPRAARQKSEAGLYHVILRGIGKQALFVDAEDNMRFLKTLSRYKAELPVEIHAYCLMKTHVHLLLRDPENNLDLFMKKLAGSYAYYFNAKYDRIGHVFHDRFKSEAIGDDSYYLAVLRYIHNNPVKAGISTAESYRWSSYREYTGRAELADTAFALELLGGKMQFEDFMHSADETECMEVEESRRVTDKKAAEILHEMLSEEEIKSLRLMNKPERDAILRSLKARGLSVRQLERLTDVGRGIILNA